jgi:hypothetical protein
MFSYVHGSLVVGADNRSGLGPFFLVRISSALQVDSWERGQIAR